METKPERKGVVKQFLDLTLDELDADDELDFGSDLDEEVILLSDSSDEDSPDVEIITSTKRLKSEDGKVLQIQVKEESVADPPKKPRRDDRNSLKAEPKPSTSRKRKEMTDGSRPNAACFRPRKEAHKSVEAVLAKLEDIYVEHRGRVVSQDGLISTPLHALKRLCEKFKEVIHNEVMIIRNWHWRKLFRVEIITGAIRGVGEAYVKNLATQMAAVDVLMKILKNSSQKNVTIPYAVYPGWRVNPQVFNDLMDICRKNNLKFPRYVTRTNVDDPELPLYSVECILGKATIGTGISDLSHIARRLAAHRAIEVITGLQCPLDYVAMGSFCTSYTELVKMGCKPAMSDTKRDFLLKEMEDDDMSNQERGIDDAELDALLKDIKQEQASKAGAREGGNLWVTVENDEDEYLQDRLVRFG